MVKETICVKINTKSKKKQERVGVGIFISGEVKLISQIENFKYVWIVGFIEIHFYYKTL